MTPDARAAAEAWVEQHIQETRTCNVSCFREAFLAGSEWRAQQQAQEVERVDGASNGESPNFTPDNLYRGGPRRGPK